MEQTGTPERKTQKIVPIGPGEAHVQNEILSKECYLCKKEYNEDMVLIRVANKTMAFACLDHKGVLQEFIAQYGRPPLGWVAIKPGETNEMGT